MTGEKLLDLLEYVDDELILGSQWTGEAGSVSSRWRKGKRKWTALLLVAVLVTGTAVAAVAGDRTEVNVDLMHFMGLDGGAVQLEDGTVTWDLNVACDGVDYLQQDEGIRRTCTFTKAESIGDDQAVFLRLDTDYEVPEDFDETTDYFLPEDYRISVENTAWKKMRGNATGYGGVLTSGVEDGKLYFLVSIEDVDDINSARVTLDVENFMLYHDLGMDESDSGDAVMDAAPEQLAYEGSWELQWNYSYHSNSRTCRLHQRIANQGKAFVVTKAVVSPMGIRIEGRMPRGRFDMNDEDMTIQINGVNLKDGTHIDLGESNQVGFRHFYPFFIELQGYNNCVQDGIMLQPDEIQSVIVNGEEIAL